MLGGNTSHRSRFGTYTVLLAQGQSAVQAFTNAFSVSTGAMLKQLQGYLERGKFASLDLAVNASLYSPRLLERRSLAPVETCFRLGDQLLRVGRLDAASRYFAEAEKLAPESPLPYEGQGLLAAESNKPQEALSLMERAIRNGSKSHLAYYIYGREKYRLLSKQPGNGGERPEAGVAEVRRAAEKALALMPGFAPAEHLLGVIVMAEGGRVIEAQRHLARAVELEPENDGYRLTLANAQVAGKDLEAARHTLSPLWLRSVDPEVRERAEEILKATE